MQRLPCATGREIADSTHPPAYYWHRAVTNSSPEAYDASIAPNRARCPANHRPWPIPAPPSPWTLWRRRDPRQPSRRPATFRPPAPRCVGPYCRGVTAKDLCSNPSTPCAAWSSPCPRRPEPERSSGPEAGSPAGMHSRGAPRKTVSSSGSHAPLNRSTQGFSGDPRCLIPTAPSRIGLTQALP